MSFSRLARQRRVGADRQDAARQGRRAKGRKATPTVAIVDSQSAKTALKGAARLRRGQEDQGPQAAHRGRHERQPAGRCRAFGWHPGRVAARAVLIRLFCRFDSIATVFVDGGYSGKLIGWAKRCSDTRGGGQTQ